MASAWIEREKRPGAATFYRVAWREIIDGKLRRRKSEAIKDKIDAAMVKAAKDAELNRKQERQISAGRALPWSDVLERWRQARLSVGRITETYGHEVVRNLTRLSEDRGWKTVADITRDQIEAWRDGVPDAKGTHKPFRQLKAVLKWARNDPAMRQPIDLEVLILEQRVQHHRSPPDLLTKDQVEKVIERAREIGERFGAIIEHLTRYGCRPIDCCRLDVGDWNSADRLLTLRHTKNGDDVTHPVAEDFARVLDNLTEGREATAPLYLSPKGERWHINRMGMAVELRDWYRGRVSSWVLPRDQWGIYILKDYAITSMERAGIDDRTKALFTGHRDLSCLERYKTTNLDSARAALAQMEVGAKAGKKWGQSGGKSPQAGKKVGADRLIAPQGKVRKAGKTLGNIAKAHRST